MSRRLSSERGFTLVELLTAMVIGLVVISAALTMLQRAFVEGNEISDRADALQRGRHAMELVTRQLRSQVCLGQAKDPIVEGKDDTVTFYADMSDGRGIADPGSAGSTNPVRRTLTYDDTTHTLTERVFAGVGTYPDLTFPSQTSSSTLLNTVYHAKDPGDLPVFRYYAFTDGGQPGEMVQLTTPLSTADVARVVMIRVSFRALPIRQHTPRNSDATQLENEVYVRIADPTDPTNGPRCI